MIYIECNESICFLYPALCLYFSPSRTWYIRRDFLLMFDSFLPVVLSLLSSSLSFVAMSAKRIPVSNAFLNFSFLASLLRVAGAGRSTCKLCVFLAELMPLPFLLSCSGFFFFFFVIAFQIHDSPFTLFIVPHQVYQKEKRRELTHFHRHGIAYSCSQAHTDWIRKYMYAASSNEMTSISCRRHHVDCEMTAKSDPK